MAEDLIASGAVEVADGYAVSWQHSAISDAPTLVKVSGGWLDERPL